MDSADHLLVVVFSDTPEKANILSSVEKVNVKLQYLTIFKRK